MGRSVLADIVTGNGRCIVRQGETVTEDLIRLAKQHGKFLELTLNVDTSGK